MSWPTHSFFQNKKPRIYLHHGVKFDGKLRQNGKNQHHSQNHGTDSVFVRTRWLLTNHGRSTSVLVHGITNKCDSHREQKDAIQLGPGIGISKGHNRHRSSRQQNRCMQPCEKGTFIGKKDFRFHLDGRLAFSWQRSHRPICTITRWRRRGTKQFLKESGLRSSRSRMRARWSWLKKFEATSW